MSLPNIHFVKTIFHGFTLAGKSPASFLIRIQENLSGMHPAERRLADFVVDFPGELASYSATELAKLANVSNATVSRFIQKLGYTNYDEARRHVRAEQRSGAALFLTAPKAADAGSVLKDHANQAGANLSQTFAATSLEEIDGIARAMLTARRVWVLGYRSGHSFATYLQWQTLQVIEQISVIPGPGQTLGEYLASVTEKDVVVVVGLRRRRKTLDRILTEFVATGSKVLYVSDESAERTAGPEWHLRCQTAAPGPLFNHVAVLGVMHLIATRVIELAGADGRVRLSAVETAHAALDEL